MTRPLRVLSISTLFPRPDKPGFGRFVARQFEELATRGDVDLTVICPIARPLLAGPGCSDEHLGFPVHYVPFASVPKLGARWNPALIHRKLLARVRAMHSEAPFDLIDAQFFYPDGPAAARIAKALDLPLSIKARGSDIHYWGTQNYALEQILEAAAAAKRLLAVSEALKLDMAKLGILRDKIDVHYTGLDHAYFQMQNHSVARQHLAMMDRGSVPIDGNLLISVGNLIPLKGQSLVIEALADLPDTRLLIAGSGPGAAILRRQAENWGVADRVHFGAYQLWDLPVALNAADAMVLPSSHEGLANAWIEALACGTPLVITDVGGAREVVTSPAAGRLIERSPQAIVAAVRDILSEVPDRTATAAHASRFSWEANAAQLAAHYQALVAG